MLKTLRYTTSLAWDLGEAFLAVFNCNNVTDQIWANAVAARRADQLVDKEAGEDVAEPECTCWPDLPYHALDCHLWYGTETPAGGEAPNPPADAPPSQTFPTAGQPTSIEPELNSSERQELRRIIEERSLASQLWRDFESPNK